MEGKAVHIAQERFPWHALSAIAHPLGAQRNGVVFVAGQTASVSTGPADTLSCSGDIVEQTRIAWEKIGVVLDAAGLSYENLVRTVDYVSPEARADYRETAAVRREHLKGSPVASTGVFVDGLLERKALIKISAVAVEGEKEAIYPQGAEFDRYKNLTYAPAVRTGAVIWLSGATGFERDESGAKVYPPDFAEQVDLTYGFLAEILADADASLADVVSRVEYIAPEALHHYSRSGQLSRPPHRELRAPLTAVGINRLLSTKRHIEVELTASLGLGDARTLIEGSTTQVEDTHKVLAAQAGNLTFFSGQTSLERCGPEPSELDGLKTQARTAYKNLSAACKAAGTGIDAILHTTEFIVPQPDHQYCDLDEVRRSFFGDNLPAVTTVLANNQIDPTQLFEVAAVAGG